MKCWLCEYNKEPDAVKLSKFLTDNAAFMGVEQLAQSIHERLQEIDEGAEGIDFQSVLEHINTHVLAPSVRVSNILRSLLELASKLENTLMVTGEDDVTVVDGKNVAVYLKVVNEIMQLYKTGEHNKLMFSSMSDS